MLNLFQHLRFSIRDPEIRRVEKRDCFANENTTSQRLPKRLLAVLLLPL